MRRSDIGPFGVLAIVAVALIQIASLASIFDVTSRWRGVVAVVVAAASGRLAAVVAARRGVPSARPAGFGALVAGSVEPLALGRIDGGDGRRIDRPRGGVRFRRLPPLDGSPSFWSPRRLSRGERVFTSSAGSAGSPATSSARSSRSPPPQRSSVLRSSSSGEGTCEGRVARRGHDVGRRQVGRRRGLVPMARAGRCPGRAVQGAEHVPQLDGDGRRCRDRPGPGDAGRGRRDRARGGDEPDPAQAGERPDEPGGRARPSGCGRIGRELPRAEGRIAPDRAHVVGRPPQSLRRRDLRGRRESGGDQPARHRHREHGTCPGSRPADADRR